MEYNKIKLNRKLTKTQIHELLEQQYQIFNNKNSINDELPDPLGIARDFSDDRVALFCALFAYGNVKAIIKFLKSCPLNELQNSQTLDDYKFNVYRFQNKYDVEVFYNSLLKIKNIQDTFYKAYKRDSILGGIKKLQEEIYKNIDNNSDGLTFLIGKLQSNSPLKRWNMFLRWMVRSDNIDLGRWDYINKSDLILPLDIHTFKISQKLGILNRKTYDIKAALEVSEYLKSLDPKDPIKYDFAIYRIGQLGLLES